MSEVVEKKQEEQADRFNEGKLEWSLVDFNSMEPLVKVLKFGTQKYAKDNWKKGLDKTEILDSLMRHLLSILGGEIEDPESGELHMGHIMCNAMFWVHFHNKEDNDTDSKQ